MTTEVRLEIADRQSAVLTLVENREPELTLYTVLPEWGMVSHKLTGTGAIKRFSDWLAKEVKEIPMFNLQDIEKQEAN